MKKLIAELDKALEATKDFGTFKHLFSDDDGERTLAELRKTVGQIRLRVKMSTMKEVKHPEGSPIKDGWLEKAGKFVAIRPCGKEYEGKTFLGLYIGDAAISSSIGIEDDKLVCKWAQYNPAIFVFDLNKIIYGAESWWGVIKSEDELRKITDFDIENVWYVKALKAIQDGKAE